MVQIQSLSFGYKKRIPLFSDLSLTFCAGSIGGVLGENGAGKSTLLKLIAGMQFPDRGRVEVAGIDPARRTPSCLNRLFFIPEELTLPPQSITSFVQQNAPFYPLFDRGEFDRYLSEFKVDTSLRFDRMSYGMRKKAYISFALACRPMLLLMDEPTNGLDIPSKMEFRRIVASYLTDDRAIVISTHQVRDLEQLIDHVTILGHRRVLLNESVAHIERQLHFGKMEDDRQAIYVEQTLRGPYGVTVNRANEESRIDLELLFGAALADADALRKRLDRGKELL